ncbi:MAG: HD domain-containing protein [Patescibacteria group bacterium]|nr:HD domain-containing protein [Patescibacteria group bacterium]
MYEKDKKFQDCSGCLAEKKTRDEDARRRYDGDQDNYMISFGSPFAIDALQKILPSKAMRRMNNKTQVFTMNKNLHVRTRATHSYEVANISTLIARILGLNENLCLAIALSHDIGHTPLGHLGEQFITQITGKEFRHEIFGVVVAQKVERKGVGLNLTHQVLSGIQNHSSGSGELITTAGFEEGNVVKCADKIAYIWDDIEDIFFRTKTFKIGDFPELKKLVGWFGKNQRERCACCVKELCVESAEKGTVVFAESEAAQKFAAIKKEMYKVYYDLDIKNAFEILEKAYNTIAKKLSGSDVDPAIVLALMPDNEAINNVLKDGSAVAEIAPFLKGRYIDFTDPDLDW